MCDVTRSVPSRFEPEVHFVRRCTAQRGVRADSVEPEAKQAHFLAHPSEAEGHEDPTLRQNPTRKPGFSSLNGYS